MYIYVHTHITYYLVRIKIFGTEINKYLDMRRITIRELFPTYLTVTPCQKFVCNFLACSSGKPNIGSYKGI